MELHHHDILPAGHPDPMLMTVRELADAAQDFAAKEECAEAHFLTGVLFARVSMQAAGILGLDVNQS